MSYKTSGPFPVSAADFEYVNSSTSSNGLTADNVRSELLHPYEVTCSHTLVQSSTPVMIVLAALICSTSLDAYSTQPAQRRSWRRSIPERAGCRHGTMPEASHTYLVQVHVLQVSAALHTCAWCPAAGYGQFLTSWGGSSMLKSLLRPVIVGVTYGLGHQSFIDCYMVHTALVDPGMIFNHCYKILIATVLACMQHAPMAQHSEPFPVVLFSHGIGGVRNAYSGICCEMSSAVRLLLLIHRYNDASSQSTIPCPVAAPLYVASTVPCAC